MKKFRILLMLFFTSGLGYTQMITEEKHNLEIPVDIFHDFQIELYANKFEKRPFDIVKTNILGFRTNTIELNNNNSRNKKLSIIPKLQVDYFEYVENDFDTEYSSNMIILPKTNIVFMPSEYFAISLNSGLGLYSHNNIATTTNTIARSYGLELGVTRVLSHQILIGANVWYFNLNNGYTYVDDQDIANLELDDQRLGIDFNASYQLNKWLSIDSKMIFARGIVGLENNKPSFVNELSIEGGIMIENYKNFSGGLRYRYFDNISAIDNQNTNKYLVNDITLEYTIKAIKFGVTLENVFNTKWEDPLVATSARLTDALETTDETYILQDRPFLIEAQITYNF